MKFKPTLFFDLSKTEFPEIFDNAENAWEILSEIGAFIKNFRETETSKRFKEIEKNIWVGENVKIAPSASITAPAIICDEAELRHNAFIRGNAIIGKGAVIGNSCEIKNSFIFNEAQIPHFNYVGDSIMGYKSHIGAGVILSNVKSIKGNVFVKNGEEKIDTGLRKFSAIVGDFAEIGCNSVLNPGTIIGKNSVVYPLSSVRGIVPESHIFKNALTIVKKN